MTNTSPPSATPAAPPPTPTLTQALYNEWLGLDLTQRVDRIRATQIKDMYAVRTTQGTDLAVTAVTARGEHVISLGYSAAYVLPLQPLAEGRSRELLIEQSKP